MRAVRGLAFRGATVGAGIRQPDGGRGRHADPCFPGVERSGRGVAPRRAPVSARGSPRGAGPSSRAGGGTRRPRSVRGAHHRPRIWPATASPPRRWTPPPSPRKASVTLPGDRGGTALLRACRARGDGLGAGACGPVHPRGPGEDRSGHGPIGWAALPRGGSGLRSCSVPARAPSAQARGKPVSSDFPGHPSHQSNSGDLRGVVGEVSK